MSTDSKRPTPPPQRTLLGIAPIRPVTGQGTANRRPVGFDTDEERTIVDMRSEQLSASAASDPAATASLSGMGSQLGQGEPATQTSATAPGRGPVPPAADLVGAELCGYRVVRKLDEGGMGMVYVAEHTKIGKVAAIKVLKPEYCRDEQVVQRFYQEARAVNEIAHENIVDIFEFGRTADGRVCFVMELLEGESLGARLKRGRLSWGEALTVLVQSLRALAAAHDKGFVHRDLKPENIWLSPRDDGGVQVKLLDFGITKLVGDEGAQDKLTRTGSFLGTPHYMSPEQINGRDIDHRSDIYSLGIMMYEIFGGERPFQGDTLNALISAHLLQEPPPIRELTAGVPTAVLQVIDRMLIKSKEARYPSMRDVLADLEDIAASRPPTHASTLERTRPKLSTAPLLPAPSMSRPMAKQRSRTPVIAAAAAAIGVIGIAAVAVVMLGRSEPTSEAAAVIVDKPAEDKTPPAPPAEPPIDYEAAKREGFALIRNALKGAEPVVRVQASDAVGEVRDVESVPVLMDLTQRDPDLEVRGHAASTLGILQAAEASETLAAQYKTAEPALKVWYAVALTRLGDANARQFLLRAAKDKDLAVAYPAATALADLSQPGDVKVIKSLVELAKREAELNDVAPFAGVSILTRLARLGHDAARKALYSTLEHDDERARLAAAEGLARLGDDAGAKALKAVLDDKNSPNRLVAARALVGLGDYAGYDLLTDELDSKEPELRRISASGLAQIGERDSLRALLSMYSDSDETVRIAAATAVIVIVGLDPQVLAQASVDWAKGALRSEDWAVRQAAARTIGDMPESEAVPLLAQAILDEKPEVRLIAAKSAARLKSPEAAKEVAVAAKAESDVAVKEAQVVALGKIKADTPEVKEALQAISLEQGRVGVMAIGSLIAIGDSQAATRLDSAFENRDPVVRVAVMQSAALAESEVVVPTLEKGVADKVFDVRFAAAEALADYRKARDQAIAVLTEGINKKPELQGRALAALVKLGAQVKDALSTEEMLASSNVEIRRSALPVIASMKWQEANPLLRRAILDPDLSTRRDAVDVISVFTEAHADDAARLYKLLLNDTDEVSRTKAKAQLAKLVEPVAPPPAQKAEAPPAQKAEAEAEDLGGVQAALDEVKGAQGKLRETAKELEDVLADIRKHTAKAAEDPDDDIDKAKELGARAQEALKKLAAAKEEVLASAPKVAQAAQALANPAAAAALVAEAEGYAGEAEKAVAAGRKSLDEADKQIKDYTGKSHAAADVYLASAETAMATGRLRDAKRDLDNAKAGYAKNKAAMPPRLHSLYGRLYEEMARQQDAGGQRLRNLEKAKESYELAARGSGSGVAEQAKERIAELAEEIASLKSEAAGE